MTEALPDIEFEGVTVKAKRGVYRCPFDCGDKRFGPQTWKTEAGFRKHMAHCYRKPSAVAKRAEKATAVDQIVRALTGCPMVEKTANDYEGKPYTFETLGESVEYLKFVAEAKVGEDGPETYSWDEGIAP